MSELDGQMTMLETAPAPVPVEGYDDEGRLLTVEQAEDRLKALAGEINAITEHTRGVVISAALAVGKRLVEARRLVPAGRFGEWLAANVSYSERKAQDMMRLYEEYGREGAIPEAFAALDYSKAVALLSAPEESREALAKRAADEDLSVRELRDEFKALKIDKAKAQMKIATLEESNGHYERELAAIDEKRKTEDEHAAALQAEVARLRDAERAKAEAEALLDAMRAERDKAEARVHQVERNASDFQTRNEKLTKELAEARAKLNEQPEPERVEVIPEEVRRELEELRKRVSAAPTPAGPTASDRFKWFYANQLQPAFASALDLLRDVAREDRRSAEGFARALTAGCAKLVEKLEQGV